MSTAWFLLDLSAAGVQLARYTQRLENLAPMPVMPIDAVDAPGVPNRNVVRGRLEVQLRAQLDGLEDRLHDMSRCLQDAEQRADELHDRATLLEEQLAVILSSRSWRLTKPLRRALERALGPGPR